MAPHADAKPAKLGRYFLFDEIASGGMASVHFGRSVGAVGFSRVVAIKRLHPHLARDPEFVSMFVDEARLAARIRDPHVVATLDVVSEADELFLVMDYVHGETLSKLMKTPIPSRVASAVATGYLRGLHAAHEATSATGEPLDIVHRDVSPQNVLVGVDGIARVLDFGVAKAAVRLHTTRDGRIKGKLAYMPPEQLRGQPLTRRADVYSSAVVLWEMLVGKRLFRGEDEGSVVEQVLLGDIPLPSSRAPGLSAELDAVVMRGLARDPAQRFATAEEMALALETALAPASVSEVAGWVKAVAGETLAKRGAVVAKVEAFDTSQISQAVAAPLPASPAEAASAESPTSISTSRMGEPLETRPRALRWPWVVAGVTVAAASIAVTFRSYAERGEGTSAAPSMASPAASVVAPPVDSATPPPVPSITPALPVAAPTATTVATASPQASSKRAGSSARPDCQVPYVRGPDGHVTFKRGCL